MTSKPIQDQKVANAIVNLEWLSQYEPPTKPEPGASQVEGGVPAPIATDSPLEAQLSSLQLPIIDFGLTKDLLWGWSKMNADAIKHAKSKQVFGGKAEIDWQTSFLSFMESIAVYLRDVSLHNTAWSKYRVFKASPDTMSHLKMEAVQDFLDSTKTIQQIADLWDMDFQVLCSLPGHHPGGHPGWDGPYCGLFTSRTTDLATGGKPFQGIAFKGTGPISLDQWMVDFNYQLQAASDGFLHGAHVSSGVFTTLFGRYEDPDTVPYIAIRDGALKSAAALLSSTKTASTVRTHITGHSLGASYATMCTAQLHIDIPPSASSTSPLSIGDTYTFGSPRVGGNAWAAMYGRLADAGEGRTWRVVHSRDLVPTVPPTSLQGAQLDFHHVDDGLRVSAWQGPERLPSEVDAPDPPPVAFDNPVAFARDLLASVDHRELLCCRDRPRLPGWPNTD